MKKYFVMITFAATLIFSALTVEVDHNAETMPTVPPMGIAKPN